MICKHCHDYYDPSEYDNPADIEDQVCPNCHYLGPHNADGILIADDADDDVLPGDDSDPEELDEDPDEVPEISDKLTSRKAALSTLLGDDDVESEDDPIDSDGESDDPI
jgi:hypothetical protein|nr:MAG TPA: Putative transcription antitermination protein nusG Regulation, Spt4, Spt5, NusG.9A [Caudoviricetes sp.]